MLPDLGLEHAYYAISLQYIIRYLLNEQSFIFLFKHGVFILFLKLLCLNYASYN